MSAVERIKQIQREENVKKQTEEVQRARDLINKEFEEARKKQEQEDFLKLLKQEFNQALEETGILKHLNMIKEELLFDANPYQIKHNNGWDRSLTLLWSKDKIRYAVDVSMDFSHDVINVTGKERFSIPKERWADKEYIEDVIVKSFTHPNETQPPIDYPERVQQ